MPRCAVGPLSASPSSLPLAAPVSSDSLLVAAKSFHRGRLATQAPL